MHLALPESGRSIDRAPGCVAKALQRFALPDHPPMLLADLPQPLKPNIRSLWQMDVGPGEQILPGWIAPDGQVEIVFHTGATTSARSFGTSEWVCQPQAFVLPMRRGALQLAT